MRPNVGIARRSLSAALAIACIGLGLGIVPLSAQARSQRGSKAGEQSSLPPDSAKPLPSAIPSDATAAPVDPKSFVLGTEDVIQVRVWREEQFSGNHVIRPDGKITIFLIGDMQAAGLTPDRLRAQLTQALAEHILKPEVIVNVLQVNSRKFSITGEVLRSGAFALTADLTVFDALSMAGGFRDFANTKDIRIVHKDGTVDHFNYNDYLKGKKRDKNIVLQNGDTIVVR